MYIYIENVCLYVDLLQVELLDKTTAEKSGLVIHYYDKEWLPLCFENVNTTDDQLNKTATVICNQLGLGTVKEARYHLTTYSSALNTDATCNGNETFVRLCKKTIWSIGTCKGIAIHVECNGKKSFLYISLPYIIIMKHLALFYV